VPEKPITFVYEPMTNETRLEVAKKRWRQDGVIALAQGVTLVPHGRAATIYFRDGDRFVALDAELAGASNVDGFIYTEPGIAAWADVKTFDTGPTSPEERRTILAAVAAWTNGRSAKYEFVPPFDTEV
jgi:hypothetical protein